jgi:cytochrome b561
MEIKKYSLVYRLIHWAIAISFIFLFLTIFLRLTWLNKSNVAGIIGSFIQGTAGNLTDDEMISLAKKIREPMWNWHIYLGYILTALFAVRFILAGIGTMKFQNPADKDLTRKGKFQKWIYLVFYVMVVVSLATGIMIKQGPVDLKTLMEGIHKLSIYYLIAFLVLHFGGIVLAEFTDQQGIVSRIINGSGKKE